MRLRTRGHQQRDPRDLDIPMDVLMMMRRRDDLLRERRNASDGERTSAGMDEGRLISELGIPPLLEEEGRTSAVR